MFKKPSQKRTALSGDYDHYWSKDPAFDAESEDFNYQLWLDTHDMKHLPIKEGQTPTRFVMRRLTEWEKDSIGSFAMAHREDGSRFLQLLVRGALRAICNAFDDGEDWKPNRIKIEDVSCVEDGVLTEIAEKDGMMLEMFEHIQRREFGSPRD